MLSLLCRQSFCVESYHFSEVRRSEVWSELLVDLVLNQLVILDDEPKRGRKMLFGYVDARSDTYLDDVQSNEACLECFAFDRPLILASELHVAGAMAFATSFGFGGMSLVEWALVQTMDSVNRRGGIDVPVLGWGDRDPLQDKS